MFAATTMDLDATDLGAETCYLGAMVHDAELRVHFSKSFQKGHICEILSPKGSEGKKKVCLGGRSPASLRCDGRGAGLLEMLQERIQRVGGDNPPVPQI
jgi:hypothetical protein